MGILRHIQRLVQPMLAHGIFESFRKSRPEGPTRLCQFGHPVFSGNHLCTYGHHRA
jgi:hypothetical protein